MNKTSLLGPVPIPVTRHRTLFLPGVHLRKYKISKQKKNFLPCILQPNFRQSFLEEGVSGQWLNCFCMAVTLTVSSFFFQEKL